MASAAIPIFSACDVYLVNVLLSSDMQMVAEGGKGTTSQKEASAEEGVTSGMDSSVALVSHG